MNRRLLYTDDTGYLRIVVPSVKFQQPRESESEALARLAAGYLPDVSEFIVCRLEDILTDLTFRDAWIKGDVHEPIRIDFPKAISIHRKRLQKAAEKKVQQLEEEIKVAVERKNLPEQVALIATQKILKTIHEADLTHCKTIDDLKKSVPKELKDVWEYYELQ